MIHDITHCGDRACPSRSECRRYAFNPNGSVATGAFGSMADFNREPDAQKCLDGFLEKPLTEHSRSGNVRRNNETKVK